MKIVIAGASGLIGSAAVPALRRAGHDVRRLVRRPKQADDEIEWDPAQARVDPAALAGCDAVVNLAGENVGAGRWTVKRRERILRSRVDTTATLIAAMEKMERRPAVFVGASAVGIYGDRGDELVTEGDPGGRGFLPDVCRAWEAEAQRAERLGVRTVMMRFGVVLAREGGALAKMLPIFRLGLGGRLGSGAQWMSWVAREDAVRAIQHAIDDARCAGPTIVAAGAVRNAEFTRALAKTLRRPAVLPVPGWILRVAFGRMAEETVLQSLRVVPKRLTAVGFKFRHEGIEEALRAVLG